MHLCVTCGTEFEGNFCPECGTAGQIEKTCPLCGVTLSGNVKFCTNCGYFFGKKFTGELKTKRIFSAENNSPKNDDAKPCIIAPLIYSLNEDKSSYTVTKISSGTKKTEIIVLKEVNHLPVTAIGRYAFKDCNKLTSVIIPESVTSIGDGAFKGCKNLTNITLPKSVTSIGSYAFYDCESLKSIIIPSSVTEIKSCMFSRCIELTSVVIPNTVTEIRSCAFKDCKALKSMIIPSSVALIGSCAFERCSGLKSITLPNSVTEIGSGAFRKCNGLTYMVIPNGVTEIRSLTFDGCSSLAHIGITYRGTKSEWNQVSKSCDWNGNGIYSVHCIDGDIK